MSLFKKNADGKHIAADTQKKFPRGESVSEWEDSAETKPKKNRALRIILVIAVVFILLAGIAYAMFARYYSLLNVQKHSSEPEETIAPKAEDIEAVDPADLEAAKPDASWDFEGKDVMNILFIGVDNDDLNKLDKRGNADGVVIISINNTTKQVVITSLMRDLSVSVKGYYRTKLSKVYHNGGVQSLRETIEENMNIPIDNYALFNYLDLINIIDAFGGVTLDVSTSELYGMTDKIINLNAMLGRPLDTDQIDMEDAGVMTLNGVQAVAYLRIRNTPSVDAERTARLRKVIMQLAEKARKMNVKELDGLATKILPSIETDLSQKTTLLLLKNALSLLNYEFITQRIPIDGTYKYEGSAFVTMDIKKNNEYLYYTIYEGHAPD